MNIQDSVHQKIWETTCHFEYSKFDINNINKILVAIYNEFYQLNSNIPFIDRLMYYNKSRIDINYAELGFVAKIVSTIGLEYDIDNEVIKEWLTILRNEAKRIVSKKILKDDNIINGYNDIEHIWNMLKYVLIYKDDIDSNLRKYLFEKASTYSGVKGTNNKDKGNYIRTWLELPTLKKQYNNNGLNYFYFLSQQTNSYLSCSINKYMINIPSEYIFQLSKNIALAYKNISIQNNFDSFIYEIFSRFSFRNDNEEIISRINNLSYIKRNNILEFIKTGLSKGYTTKELIELDSEKYMISEQVIERTYYNTLIESKNKLANSLGFQYEKNFIYDRQNKTNKTIWVYKDIDLVKIAQKEYKKAEEYSNLNDNSRYCKTTYFSNIIKKYKKILSKKPEEYIAARVAELKKIEKNTKRIL